MTLPIRKRKIGAKGFASREEDAQPGRLSVIPSLPFVIARLSRDLHTRASSEYVSTIITREPRPHLNEHPSLRLVVCRTGMAGLRQPCPDRSVRNDGRKGQLPNGRPERDSGRVSVRSGIVRAWKWTSEADRIATGCAQSIAHSLSSLVPIDRFSGNRRSHL